MAASSLKCIFASLPKTTRGQAIVINGDPNEENFLYVNGKNVFLRDLQNPSKCEIYADHAGDTSVAKYSPSRYYIASGDATGKVRIWDTVNPQHLCKGEFSVLGGRIKDIDWSPDNQKVAVVGEGRETMGKVIAYDAGNSFGNLDGHTKAVNSVAYRQARPFRVVTASEDFHTHFYEGPPFKYKAQNMEHTNFANCVRYQPSGDLFVTAGQDGKVLLYDGKTSEFKGSFGGEKAHAGGIYAVSFSPNGKELLTASGDKTAKIWNVETQELVTTFTMGKAIDDMQLGCLWQKVGNSELLITVSLSGFINYLDRNNPESPSKILKGHNKPITAMAVTSDKSRLYTGGTEGKIFGWDVNTGLSEEIQGKGHTNQIKEMAVIEDTLITVSMDDTIRYTDLASNSYGSSTSLPSQPTSMAAIPGQIAVVTCVKNQLAVVLKGNVVFTLDVKYEPFCVDIHPGCHEVAVGSKSDNSVHIYGFDGTTLTFQKKVSYADDIVDVKFSPDGSHVVVCTGSQRQTYLCSAATYETVYKAGKQTGRIFSVAWSPDSQHFATASLDGSIAVWCLDPKYVKSCCCVIKDAHKKAQSNKIHWLSDNLIVSAGSDACVKQFTVKFE